MKHLGDYFNDEKMFTYLRGFAMGKHWVETPKAMNYARELHRGQKRKSGEPYIIHPLLMSCQALAFGLEDDNVIATLLLHDVVEDCGVSVNDLPVNEEIKQAVGLLTFKKPIIYYEKDGVGKTLVSYKEEYYANISDNEIASVCKIIDRCNNISSMSGVFSKEKMIDYIDETNHYVMPLLKNTKEKFPKYDNILFVLKYHMVSVLCAIDGLISNEEEN